MRKMLSIKLRQEEFDELVKSWLDYIMNTGDDLTRHGFLKTLLLREQKVVDYFESKSECKAIL
jgi:hypothetical protein